MSANKTSPSNPKQFFKQWLEKLQQESWQLELLISGLALFGIYEGKPWIDRFAFYVDENISSHEIWSPILGAFELIFKVGWWIFFVNLLVHVILRSLWIGAIGLRYISSDIEYDELNYSEVFTNYLRKKVGDYDDFIERLERICSVLFAYTFLLFLLFLSFILFFAWFPIIGSLADSIFDLEGDSVGAIVIFLIAGAFYILIGLIVFIDFLSLGLLKKVKDPVFSKMYLYVFRFYSIITLSFLYRPLLYNFIDHPYTKKLFFLSIPYMLAFFFGPTLITNHPDHILMIPKK